MLPRQGFCWQGFDDGMALLAGLIRLRCVVWDTQAHTARGGSPLLSRSFMCKLPCSGRETHKTCQRVCLFVAKQTKGHVVVMVMCVDRLVLAPACVCVSDTKLPNVDAFLTLIGRLVRVCCGCVPFWPTFIAHIHMVGRGKSVACDEGCATAR